MTQSVINIRAPSLSPIKFSNLTDAIQNNELSLLYSIT
jgi:hypothetical protein